jgi:hypothetical protein
MVAVEVRTGAFAIPLPDGWQDRTVLTISGPDAEGYAPNVVVTRERLCDHIGLGGYSSGWLNRLREEVPVVENAPVEHATIAGVPAHLRRVSWNAAGLRLTQLAALFVVDADGYAIIATATDWRFGDLEPVFRAVIDGFTLSVEAQA